MQEGSSGRDAIKNAGCWGTILAVVVGLPLSYVFGVGMTMGSAPPTDRLGELEEWALVLAPPVVLALVGFGTTLLIAKLHSWRDR